MPTVCTAVRELEIGAPVSDRVRRAGAGRKRLAQKDPGLTDALEPMVDPSARGARPCGGRRSTTRQLADALTSDGHGVSSWTVGQLRRRLRCSLQGTQKTIEGTRNVDRSAQFDDINQQAEAHLSAGLPVVSVDAKKEELVGEYANSGSEWQPAGSPVRVKGS